jgi:phosphoglycerol transferase MdoB-like AlkP superfamily enzyme
MVRKIDERNNKKPGTTESPAELVAWQHSKAKEILFGKLESGDIPLTTEEMGPRHGPAPTIQSCYIGLSANRYFDQKSAKNVQKVHVLIRFFTHPCCQNHQNH